MNILITGKTGQLGQTFKALSVNYPKHNFTFVGRDEFDLSDSTSISTYFKKHSFNVIINCAAYTAVDKAESEPELADQINHQSVAQLAEISKQQKAKFIHISTDYVFDGNSNTPYTEQDTTNPVNIYAKTKCVGEQAIFNAMPTNAFIIRSSWIYSEYGNNFVNAILKLAKDRDALSIVADQIGTPTYAHDLATTIVHIINSTQFSVDFTTTLYHYANEGECSWYNFAQEIVALNGINCKVMPITTEEYPTTAKRPLYTVLNKDKIIVAFNLTIPSWQTSLKACINS